MSYVQTGIGRKERGRKPPVFPGTVVLKYKNSKGHTPNAISNCLMDITTEIYNRFYILQRDLICLYKELLGPKIHNSKGHTPITITLYL